MNAKKLAFLGAVGTISTALAGPSIAGSDHSLGKTLHKNNLVIQPVYIQPVTMAPSLPGINQKQADIHLEVDIHADEGNKHGFSEGSWIPGLGVSYMIQKKGSDWSSFGTLMPMVASDGPHYGRNVQLDGPGEYTAQFKIKPPVGNGVLRHTTKDTGVPAWWQPIEQGWTFTYTGIGKKGGY